LKVWALAFGFRWLFLGDFNSGPDSERQRHCQDYGARRRADASIKPLVGTTLTSKSFAIFIYRQWFVG